MTTSNSQKIAQRQHFIPFGSVIDPTTGEPTHPPNGSPDTPFTFTSEGGVLAPQIQCPAGTKINILGAFFDVFDPYAECSLTEDNVNPYFGFLCIPDHVGKTRDGKTVAICNNKTDCSKYGISGQYTCGPQNTCVLADYGSTSCPAGLSPIISNGKKYCVDANVCGSNIQSALEKNKTGVPNPFCSPNNTNAKCAIRDASATVAKKCNGRQECGDLTVADFGDYPCNGVAPTRCIVSANGKDITWYTPKDSDPTTQGKYRTTGYCSLPFLYGYKGGVPNFGDGSEVDANYNHGYSLHGIYSCVTE